MRLSSKLTLSHLAVALVPAGVILGLTWTTAEAQFDEEFSERLDSVTEALRIDLAQIGQNIGAKTRALLESEEVERVLVDMIRGSLDRRALISVAGEWMRTGELDLLVLMDGDGRVLSSGHLPARFGSLEPALSSLSVERPLSPAIQPVQISRDGQIQEQLCVVVGVARKFQEAEVRIAGGRMLDQAFVDHLESLAGAAVAIVGPGDLPIAQGKRALALGRTNQGERASPGLTPRKIPLGFSGERGEQTYVLAQFSRARLEEAERSILLGSAGAALSGVVISFLLGLWISRRISKPVQALLDGARRVAAGDLGHQVNGAGAGEVGELVQSFNAMVTLLGQNQRQLVRAERVAAWQEIARRIAHEIKNPLSPIQVSIETLQKAYQTRRSDFEEIFEESTRAILDEVAAMKRIVTEFSDFARLPKPTPAPEPLNPIVENAILLYRGQHPGVALAFEPQGDLPDALVDRELIGRVLSNLLQNAFQSVGEGGLVRVTTGLRAERLFVRIEDNGIGMSPEVLAKVFTPYFTTRKDGTGLGLSIVQRIVADHDGSIDIESELHRGTAVTIQLPFA